MDAKSKFSLDVNRHHTNKITYGKNAKLFKQFSNTFQTIDDMDAHRLADAIQQGFAWTSPIRKVKHMRANGTLSTHRKKQNIISVQVLALDADTEDERSTFDAWEQDAFAGAFASFLHTSSSHTEAEPRARVVFELDEPITVEEAEDALHGFVDMYNNTPQAQTALALLDAMYSDKKSGEYKTALAAHKKRYARIDAACVDAGRLFYGAKECKVLHLGNVLPVAELRRYIIEPYRAKQDAEQAEKQAERAALLASRPAVVASGSQASAYVQTAIQNEIDTLAGTLVGRHAAMRDASLRLASYELATWHSCDMTTWQEDIANAMIVNGYTAKYGAPEQRTDDPIANALALATPADEPIWNTDSTHFHVGDDVTATAQNGRVIGSGRIDKQRQAYGSNDWECLVNGAWFARSLLTHGVEHEVVPEAVLEPIDSTPEPAPEGLPPMPDTPPDEHTAQLQAFACRDMEADDTETQADAVQVVTVPAGKYLSQVEFERPRYSLLDARTGSGKSHYAATQKGFVILACSQTIAVQQLGKRHNIGMYYGEEKIIKDVTACTYDSTPQVLKEYVKRGIRAEEVTLFIDEQHNFALAGYRKNALKNLYDMVQAHDWKSVCYMSGTPINSELFKGYARIKVQTPQRTQAARFIQWQFETQEGQTVGVKRNTISALVKRHAEGVTIVHYNNKSKGLLQQVASLAARGVPENTMYMLNSDTKYESIGKHIVQHETLPEDCKVLFVTDVFIESANLNTKIDAVIFADAMTDEHLQQMVNRCRTAAPTSAYVLTTGTGNGYKFDTQDMLQHLTQAAEGLANSLNLFGTVTSEQDAERKMLAKIEFGRLVNYDELTETYTVSKLGILQSVYTAKRAYMANNPRAMANALKAYNWQFSEPEQLVLNSRASASEKAHAERLTTENDEQFVQRVAEVADMTAEQAEVAMYTADSENSNPRMKRAVQHALDLHDINDDWEQACAVLATTKDSQTAYRNAKDVLRIAFQRATYAHEGTVIQAIYDAFSVNEMYTRKECHSKLLAIYEQFDYMKPFAEVGYALPWSKEKTARLTEQEAMRVLKLLFTTKNRRVREAGKQCRKIELTGTDVLETLVKTGRNLMQKAKQADASAVPPFDITLIRDSAKSGTPTDTQKRVPVIAETSRVHDTKTDAEQWQTTFAERMTAFSEQVQTE